MSLDFNTSFFIILVIVSIGILISFVVCFLIVNKYNFNVSIEKEKIEVNATYSNLTNND